jgi:hypothetical protein
MLENRKNLILAILLAIGIVLILTNTASSDCVKFGFLRNATSDFV